MMKAMDGQRYPSERLSQVIDVHSGYAFKSTQWRSSGVPVVKIANVKNGEIDLSEEMSFVSQADAEESGSLLHEGDIVVAMTGYVGEVARVPGHTKLVLNQRVGLVSMTSPRVQPDYIYYALRSSAFRMAAQNLAYGSAQPNISPSLLLEIRIPVPPLSEQRAIAEVLGALDDKIAANSKLTRTCEELSKAVFTQLVNRGAGACTLDSVAELISGRLLAREDYNESGRVVVYGSNSVMGRTETSNVPSPVTVLARIGSSCGALRWVEGPAWVNNNACAIVAKDQEVSPWILRLALQTIDMTQFRSGSGQPFIQTKPLMSSDIEIPTYSESDAELLRTLSKRSSAAEQESATLAELRDTLLPALMDGTIRVKDAVARAEGVL